MAKKKSKKDIKDIAETIRKENRKKPYSDVNGSYTGTASDGAAPQQDADDL